MSLTGTSASGTVYRLESGMFRATPTSASGVATTVSTDSDPDASTIVVPLREGEYTLELLPSWMLARVADDGTTTPVAATLISDNPRTVTIVAESATTATYRFFVAEDGPVTLEDGTLVIDIDIETCTGEDCECTPREIAACPAPCGVGSRVCSDDGRWGECLGMPTDETCDGRDNDCDGATDEGVTSTCYADQDGDGYGDPSDALEACIGECPAGYALVAGDCCDTDARVHPGQVNFFDSFNLCGSFDYNCDGALTRRENAVGRCSGTFSCSMQMGWDGPVPGCGAVGQWVTACQSLTCQVQTIPQVQGCR